ncbi:hypothetical protein BK120_01180 [Paenibacillus sp. FSL A5-0031]|uniref:hypothetical protein n=1 Tax=Paenibacillus sp. FSL A5-0031 TaxID=1920420 RepID=UPI00096BD7F2|nr:hypothetical protein [Paenibacillus sp. FSL A5-0031]OME87964.1 hypothetical protein BK120_01180 [Paenibacillus sp. FSL A5-0031]
MRKIIIAAGLLCFILVCLAACSASAPVTNDPAAIEVDLRTDPDKPVSGSPIELMADFTGAELTDSSGMTFEVRVKEEPVFIEAKKKGQNVFSGTYTFREPGTYEVYMHLYTDDIHVTKKKQVEVQ